MARISKTAIATLLKMEYNGKNVIKKKEVCDLFSKIISSGNLGINGYTVFVECDVSNGMPSFEIVGLGDSAVKESRERVRSALKNSGFDFPVKRITVNLAPANLKKEGSVYDLAIAAGILASTGQLKTGGLQKIMFLGELALDGRIRHVNGVLPMVFSAAGEGIARVILPEDDAGEASVMKSMAVTPVSSLREAVDMINGVIPFADRRFDENAFQNPPEDGDFDFAEVKGQGYAKRALEIAASGGHNLLMTGSPGTGKTLLAKCMPGILPDMNADEAIEVTRIYSVAGLLPPGTQIIRRRPFRNPHFSISASSLIGGGRIPKPGELSLSHNGVLFLDEVAEFSINALNSLRQPLEDRSVCISRVNGTLDFPANVSVIAAANPCKCGYCMDDSKKCVCSHEQIRAYRSKLSGPLIDRIDLLLEMTAVRYSDITDPEEPENSAAVKSRVAAARDMQADRYSSFGIRTNSQLTHNLLPEFCRLDDKAEKVLRKAFEKFSLSARSYVKILKVARTAADLDSSDDISPRHVSEAVQFRCFESKWGI